MTSLSESQVTEFVEQTPYPHKIAVLGLGFVGLPLALSFALRGCQVVGLDVSQDLINELENGITHHTEAFHGMTCETVLRHMLKRERFIPTADVEMLADCRGYIITVGLPVRDGRPVYDHVVSATRSVARTLKPGDVVVIRSTVIPGTTEKMLKPILEESGLVAGVDFHLGYASERIAEGRAFDEFENMPLVMAGTNAVSSEKVAELLKVVTKAPVHTASQIAVVEISKVFENVQRDVNIAMVQEFARVSEYLGLDINEVISLANTHKRVNLLSPGPGVGGYCIPNAYYYLRPAADEQSVPLDLLKKARQINDEVPYHVVNLVREGLAAIDMSLDGATVSVLGLAMKDYSNDDRLSPALKIVSLLERTGAIVRSYDPVVPTSYPHKVPDAESCFQNSDCVLVLARQQGIDDHLLQTNASRMRHRVVVDTRNAINPSLAKECGFVVVRI